MDMEKCSWEFNESVAKDFDNHVSASVPGYEWFHYYIVRLAGFYIEDDDSILDIGCSTGTLLRDIKRKLPNRDFYMTGVDKSPSMIDIAKSNVHDIKANFFTGDILEFFDMTDPSVRLSFITIMLTLQFLSYEDRFNVLKTCYSRLKEGGAVVVVEKIIQEDGHMQSMFDGIYQEMKFENGLSKESLFDKTLSLRGKMKPLYSIENEELFSRCGFDYVPFMQIGCFKGWILRK
jgi:tRNA (cmo5U34)-methyltransferase